MSSKKIASGGRFGGVAALLCLAFLVMPFGVAEAHLPVAEPDKFTVSSGEAVNIAAGLAEPLIEFAYSPENLLALGYAGNFAELTGNILYADGSAKEISFSPSDEAKPGESTFSKAVVPIEKTGTSVISMKFDFNSGTRPTVAYGKTLVNWAKDGVSTKRAGGDDVLEIVQAEDTGPLSAGDGIAVKVFLRGRELPGATASATYKGAPLPDPDEAEEGEESNNEYLHKDTDASGLVAFNLDRPGTWVVAMEYVDEAAPKNKREYDEGGGYEEWKGIRYRASLVFEVAE
ncbi:MAG: DUF4198 domain-containing protein [Synergistaceae bacterium]|nr:DUF4198 domain-containing protein [Synergistaceae bacterium]